MPVYQQEEKLERRLHALRLAGLALLCIGTIVCAGCGGGQGGGDGGYKPPQQQPGQQPQQPGQPPQPPGQIPATR